MRINRKFKTIRPTDSWHQAAIAPTNGVTTPQHITRPCDRHMMRPRRIGDRENKKRTEELHIRKDWIIPFSPIFADVGPARELHRRCRNSASRRGFISAASGVAIRRAGATWAAPETTIGSGSATAGPARSVRQEAGGRHRIGRVRDGVEY